ncbi:cupin domain-containing protein [Microbacterium gorillae]|uniref:cupin domain-containing protein n=1 Tax=Microbacterium gorillae TaxID=1231063 RepID=UPI0006945677|nr:cupin domain-containing protein [Microbacterium gorillae]
MSVGDGPAPVSRDRRGAGGASHEIWVTAASPAVIGAGAEDPTTGSLTVPPPRLGTRIRINEFLPGHLDDRGLQSPVHRTESIDYGIVLDGQITLLLDDEEVTAHAGDIIIQRGTDHAWANRGDTVARVAFILVGGTFGDDVLEALPADVRESLMTHGPRDGAAAKGEPA